MIVMTPEIREIATTALKEYGEKASAFAAVPYAQALRQLPDGATAYGADSVEELLHYLRSNLKGWRGETAAAVKATITGLLK